MVSFEPVAGNRHFSTSLPTFAGLSVFSAGLNRQPARSWLYIGQSAGSKAVALAEGRSSATAATQATNSAANAPRLASVVRFAVIGVGTPDGVRRESARD